MEKREDQGIQEHKDLEEPVQQECQSESRNRKVSIGAPRWDVGLKQRCRMWPGRGLLGQSRGEFPWLS